MAAQGLRDVGDGHEPIASPEEVAQLRQQARVVLRLAIVSTAIATVFLIVASL